MLASCSELRHDTILYVKQSYTMAVVLVSDESTLLPPKFYATVEPAPEVIQALLRLSQTMRSALVALDAMPDGLNDSLKGLDGVLQQVLGILRKQLSNTPRDQADTEFLVNIGKTFTGLTARLAANLAPPPPQAKPGQHAGRNLVDDMSKVLRTTLVSDVHTDLNTARVLQEGVGRVRWLVAVDRHPDGTLSASIGPVFSHYEFVHALNDRLTDEAWRKLLASDGAPPRTSGVIENGYQRFCTATTTGCER